MSKLYIRQKVFSIPDRFTVKNEYEEDRFLVEGEMFSWGKRLHIRDMIGNELALVRQKVWTWLPRYHVEIDGREKAVIVREFSFFKPRYRIEGLDWHIEGNFWEHDYSILRQGREVVRIQKAWFTWGDSYELDVAEGEDELMALALVLAIDAIQAQAAAAASAAAN